MEFHGLLTKAAALKNLKPHRLAMHWRNSKNKKDCGVYVMRHMECYIGNGLVGFDIGIEDKDRDKAIMTVLRIKYLYIMLRYFENRLADHVATSCANQ